VLKRYTQRENIKKSFPMVGTEERNMKNRLEEYEKFKTKQRFA